MLYQPAQQRMRGWDLLFDTLFCAQFQRSEQAPHCSDPHLCASIGLALVLLGLFRGRRDKVFYLTPHDLEHTLDQRQERFFVVALDDQTNMTKPGHILSNGLGDLSVSARSFVRHSMRKDALEFVAPHDQALHDVTGLSCCFKAPFSVIILWKRQFFSLLHSSRGDVPVVHSNTRNGMRTALMPAPLLSEASSSGAFVAPASVGNVSYLMLLDLGVTRHARSWCYRNRGHFLLFLFLDLHQLAVVL